MIHDIREAFNELLEENDWMDTETRKVAEDKANSMTERIGYPEYITNDTRLQEEYTNVRKSRSQVSRLPTYMSGFFKKDRNQSPNSHQKRTH